MKKKEKVEKNDFVIDDEKFSPFKHINDNKTAALRMN